MWWLVFLSLFTVAKEKIVLSASDLPTVALTGSAPKLGDPEVKLLLLDVWASWCEPCREAVPFYSELQKKYEAKGVRFIGVGADEDLADAKEFVKKVPFGFPAVWDKGRALTNKLRLDAIPTLIFVDAKGEILEIESGFTKAKRDRLPERIESFLKK